MDVTGEPSNPKPPAQGQLSALVESMRVGHWVKNAFVAAPLLFSGRFTDGRAWLCCLGAVASFCLLSSGVYLLNDIRDRHRDRHHPAKKFRPLACGRLSASVAAGASGALIVLGLAIVAAIEAVTYDPSKALGGAGLLVWTGLYLAINVLYSLGLKNHAVVDVILVAMGFVMRAMAGASAIGVPISPWLVLCTFTLCLYIALGKRRSEMVDLTPEQAALARKANRSYSVEYVEHMLTVSSAVAILTYSLYCVAPRTVLRAGSAHMIWTIPLVIYGLFRYWRLAGRAGQGDPVLVVLRDRVMWAVLVSYVLLVGVILTYGRQSGIREILDM